jgi:hypothetical protein
MKCKVPVFSLVQESFHFAKSRQLCRQLQPAKFATKLIHIDHSESWCMHLLSPRRFWQLTSHNCVCWRRMNGGRIITRRQGFVSFNWRRGYGGGQNQHRFRFVAIRGSLECPHTRHCQIVSVQPRVFLRHGRRPFFSLVFLIHRHRTFILFFYCEVTNFRHFIKR